MKKIIFIIFLIIFTFSCKRFMSYCPDAPAYNGIIASDIIKAEHGCKDGIYKDCVRLDFWKEYSKLLKDIKTCKDIK